MRTESNFLTAIFPANAPTVFRAWLNSREHTAFTGGKASIKPEEGSSFTAWDGYISGEVLGIEENSRILLSWRTSEFPEDADDSLVEILFRDSPQGCMFTLRHSSIPQGDGEKYHKGWQEHYLTPMQTYFSQAIL